MISTAAFMATLPSGPVEDPRSFFHPTWYVSRYPQVRHSGLDPWTHYTAVGEPANLQPHPLFEPVWYRKQTTIETGLLAHYAIRGRIEAVRPHPLLHPVNYAEDVNELSRREPASPTPFLLPGQQGGLNSPTILRYLLSSDDDWRFPNPWFDRSWYRRHYSNELSDYGDPLSHYVGDGGFRGFSTGQHWDWRVYLERNPDVLLSQMTPLEHYLRMGHAESRRPSKIPLMSMLKAAAGDHDDALVVNLLRSHLGWDVTRIRIVEIRGQTSLVPAAPATVRRISTALLVEQSDRVVLVGTPDKLHEVNSHLLVGRLGVLPEIKPELELMPCLVCPDPTDDYFVTRLILAICHCLDWQTPMICSEPTMRFIKSLLGSTSQTIRLLIPSKPITTQYLPVEQTTLEIAAATLKRSLQRHGLRIDATVLAEKLRPESRAVIHEILTSVSEE